MSRGDPFTYQEEDGSWSVGAEIWPGGSWSSYYVRLAHGLPDKTAATSEAGEWRYSIKINGFVRKEEPDETTTPGR